MGLTGIGDSKLLFAALVVFLAPPLARSNDILYNIWTEVPYPRSA